VLGFGDFAAREPLFEDIKSTAAVGVTTMPSQAKRMN
jgi:hypothetical protein